MIKLFVFDMGGVMIRDYHIAPELNQFLGMKDALHYNDNVFLALKKHSEGLISEEEFWITFKKETNKEIPKISGSLLGRFFHPVLDSATVNVVKKLKENGKRVVCGTNVIAAHYDIHKKKKQYDIFDKVYASNFLQVAKPKPEFYEKICEAEKVKENEMFFTDDLEINVEVAKALGINAFLYKDAFSLEKELQKIGAFK